MWKKGQNTIISSWSGYWYYLWHIPVYLLIYSWYLDFLRTEYAIIFMFLVLEFQANPGSGRQDSQKRKWFSKIFSWMCAQVSTASSLLRSSSAAATPVPYLAWGVHQNGWLKTQQCLLHAWARGHWAMPELWRFKWITWLLSSAETSGCLISRSCLSKCCFYKQKGIKGYHCCFRLLQAYAHTQQCVH